MKQMWPLFPWTGRGAEQLAGNRSQRVNLSFVTMRGTFQALSKSLLAKIGFTTHHFRHISY